MFQFYPENECQLNLLTSQAMKAGFYGGVVIDFPNSAKAKKFFLVLMTGGAAPLPQALGNLLDTFSFISNKYEHFGMYCQCI